MSGRLWHKHYHRDFLEGVHGLGADVIGAYIVVLNLIYSRDGRCPDDPKFIGAILGETTRTAAKLVDRLVGLGKLRREGMFLVNEKATAVLDEDANRHKKFAESGAKGGRERAKREAESRGNNDLTQGSLNHTRAKKEIREEDKTPSVGTIPPRAPDAAPKPVDGSPPSKGQGAAPSPQSPLASVAAEVRKRAKMVEPPGDVSVVEAWLADRIDPEKDIYPTAETIGQREVARGKAVRTFRYLDQAVREAHAARTSRDRADVEKFNRITAAYGDNPSLEPPRRAAGGIRV